MNSVCPCSHHLLTSEAVEWEVSGGWSTVSSEVRHVCQRVRMCMSLYKEEG